MGFLDLLAAMTVTTPTERRQAQRVTQLRDAMASAAQAKARRDRLDDLRADVTTEQLHAVIRHQDEQLDQLTAAVGVLVQMLGDAGTIDADDFRWRVEATLLNDEPEPATKAADPAKAEPTITCKNCQRVVPRKDSEITARGVVCERCALAASY